MNNPAHTFNTTKSAPGSAVANGLSLCSAGEFHAKAPSLSGRIVAANWTLEIFTSGGIELEIGAKPWKPFTAGAGVLYPPRTAYRERLRRESDFHRCSSLHIIFEDRRGHLREKVGDVAFIRLRDAEGTAATLLQRIVLHLDGGSAASLRALGAFYELISLLLSAESRGGELLMSPRDVASPDLVAQVHGYLREHLADSVRLEHLARRVGLSESGLSHAYRRLTGRSPMAALRALRVEAAKVRLVRGNLKLEAIASETGFADAFHLSRTFKQILGVSPTQYLRGAAERSSPRP